MDFQSYYVFNPSKMVDLRIGAAMLREAMDRETQKEEQSQRNREEQKAAAATVAQNVRFFLSEDSTVSFASLRSHCNVDPSSLAFVSTDKVGVFG